MKTTDFNRRISNGSPHKGGSILIWTVMLGLLLTSVFFFFSMRQRMMVAEQRDTATQQSTKMLLESYADYLQKHPAEITFLAGGKYYAKKTIEGIETKLTQKVDSIENSIDTGEGQKRDYAFTGSIYVEWNRCSDSLKGDLLVNGVLYKHESPASCEEYADVAGPLSVSGTPSTPLTIKTQNAPFFFRIKAAAGTQLIDNLWHLELSKDLGYGKMVTVRRTFPVVLP